jgi:hypothetical protein
MYAIGPFLFMDVKEKHVQGKDYDGKRLTVIEIPDFKDQYFNRLALLYTHLLIGKNRLAFFGTSPEILRPLFKEVGEHLNYLRMVKDLFPDVYNTLSQLKDRDFYDLFLRDIYVVYRESFDNLLRENFGLSLFDLEYGKGFTHLYNLPPVKEAIIVVIPQARRYWIKAREGFSRLLLNPK